MRGIILCAGKGTRMNSNEPKCLKKILGKEMLFYIIDELKEILDFEVVVNKKMEYDLNYVIQEEPKGCAHAVKICNPKGSFLVFNGDVPFVKKEHIIKLIKKHKEEKNECTILVNRLINNKSYGRVLNNKIGEFETVNCFTGIAVFEAKAFNEKYDLIDLKNGEYQITDIINLCRTKSLIVNDKSLVNINDLKVLKQVEKKLLKKINDEYLLKGIETNSYIDIYSYINNYSKVLDSKIEKTIIGKNTTINNSTIINSIILDNTTINNAVITNSIIYDNCIIGPFSRINDSIIRQNNIIGSFVELNRVNIRFNNKVKHLAYLGDTILEDNNNIGCGVITCNYNGIDKNITKIGNNNFIGANTNIIAPRIINDNNYICSSVVVKEDIENDRYVKDDKSIIIKPRYKD